MFVSDLELILLTMDRSTRLSGVYQVLLLTGIRQQFHKTSNTKYLFQWQSAINIPVLKTFLINRLTNTVRS